MQTQDPVVNVSLPISKLNVVLGSLAKQPFEMVADLINDIRTQAGNQLMAMQAQPMAPAAPEGDKPPEAPATLN